MPLADLLADAIPQPVEGSDMNPLVRVSKLTDSEIDIISCVLGEKLKTLLRRSVNGLKTAFEAMTAKAATGDKNCLAKKYEQLVEMKSGDVAAFHEGIERRIGEWLAA